MSQENQAFSARCGLWPVLGRLCIIDFSLNSVHTEFALFAIAKHARVALATAALVPLPFIIARYCLANDLDRAMFYSAFPCAFLYNNRRRFHS